MKFTADVNLDKERKQEALKNSDVRNLLLKAIELLGDNNQTSSIIKQAEEYIAKAGV